VGENPSYYKQSERVLNLSHEINALEGGGVRKRLKGRMSSTFPPRTSRGGGFGKGGGGALGITVGMTNFRFLTKGV